MPRGSLECDLDMTLLCSIQEVRSRQVSCFVGNGPFVDARVTGVSLRALNEVQPQEIEDETRTAGRRRGWRHEIQRGPGDRRLPEND